MYALRPSAYSRCVSSKRRTRSHSSAQAIRACPCNWRNCSLASRTSSLRLGSPASSCRQERITESISPIRVQSPCCSASANWACNCCSARSSLARCIHAFPAFAQHTEQADHFVQTFQRQADADIGEAIDAVVVEPRQALHHLTAVLVVERAIEAVEDVQALFQ